MIPEQAQQDIKARADIVEVVGYFLSLKKAGSRYQALCPFHTERTPSLHITPGRQIFKCFGCGKGGDVFAFIREHENLSYPGALQWVANFYGITVDGKAPEKLPPPRYVAPLDRIPALPPSFTGSAVFRATLQRYESNNLVQYLCRKLGQALVMEAVRLYHIGTANDSGTIFWQVNFAGKTGTGKIMFYPANDHHRDKLTPPTWTHAKAKQTDPKQYNWVKYWFGEHLLAQYPTRPVAIVESEKTALVCSIYFAKLGFVWLANGGKDLSREKWEVLKGRTVYLYPDLGDGEKGQTPFLQWENSAAQMRVQGIDARVNDYLEKQADTFERGQKYDLADFLLSRDLSEFLNPTPAPAPPPLAEPPTPPDADQWADLDFAPELARRFDFRFDGSTPITAAPPPPADTFAEKVEQLAKRLSACTLPAGAVALDAWQTILYPPVFVAGHLDFLRGVATRQTKQPYFERLSAFLGIVEQQAAQ